MGPFIYSQAPSWLSGPRIDVPTESPLIALPQVHVGSGVRVMVFNSTFNNISVISWGLVLLVEEIGVPEKSTDMPQVTDNFIAHCCIDYRVHLARAGFELTALVLIGTDCIGLCSAL